MNKVVKYLANNYEDAVIKVMQSGDRYVKFIGKDEFLAFKESKVAYGDMGIELIEITEEEYNTFGEKWKFSLDCKKIPIG